MAQRDIKKIDKTILDNFYKLVHSTEHIRLTAASSTFKILNAMNKNSKPDVFNANLNYSVDRLVAGLASSRALARRGYGTLLLEVLKSFHVSTERIFTIAQQKFGQVSKETTRDNLLAYLLLISIILESGNYKRSKANQQYLEKVYKCLMQMINIKSYLEFSVCNLLVNYYDLFHSYMLADMNPQVFGSDSRASAVDLLMIVLCNKKEPIRAAVNLDTPTLMNLCYSLLDEKFQRRPLHPVFLEVSQFIIKHYPNNFEKFHSDVLQPTFFKANHNDLASMGLEFMSSLIESTEDTKAIEIILSEHLIRLLILSLRNHTSLYVQCNKFFTTLRDHFEQMKDGTMGEKSITDEKQYTILLRLTSPPGSVAFDEDSKSSSVSDLLHNSTPNVLRKYLERMISLLSKQPSKGESQQLEQSCAKQISFIVRRPQMTEDQSTITKVSKYLLLNSMFRLRDDSSKSVEALLATHSLPRPLRTLSESSRQSFKSAYHTTLDHIVSASTSQDRVKQLESLVSFADVLFNQADVQYVRPDVDECSDSSFEKLWSNYITSLDEHRSLVTKNKVTKQLCPITTLYFFYGLQILEHGLDCSSQLEELAQSAEEVLKGDPADGSWADVMTDQIIALLSATECQPWIRKLCESVFGSLLPHISQTSIDLLCDAIKAPHDEAEVDEEDEEGDEDEEGEKSEDGGSDDEESDEDEDIDSESGGDSITGSINQPDKEDAMSVDEEEEYLDDDQMMKLDTVIADMFKLNRAGKKKNDPAFKLRLLDLVKKIVTKKHNDVETINTLLSTIIPLAISSRKMNETKPIAGKITSILTKMPGKSKYPQLNKVLP